MIPTGRNLRRHSVALYDRWIYVNTDNAVDWAHVNIPAPYAPSLVCLEKTTGTLVWADNSPGTNIFHIQWSSPLALNLDGAGLSRFSKIRGEMVPHIKVEEELQELSGSLDRALVVTGVGDDRKGERLLVLHCLEESALHHLLAKLPQLNLPKLWVPKATTFYHLDAMPLLGSGKLDLRKVREVASRCAAE